MVTELDKIFLGNKPCHQRNDYSPDNGGRDGLRNVGVLSTCDTACCPRRFYQVYLLYSLGMRKLSDPHFTFGFTCLNTNQSFGHCVKLLLIILFLCVSVYLRARSVIIIADSYLTVF
jgi:hypothetical protein